jgi:hypothetical protein
MEDSLMKLSRCSACLIVAILIFLPFASALDAAEMDGVMMRNGKMMIVKHGKPAMPMDDDITVGDGTVVSADGTVKLKGGHEFRMRNGEMMMRDGHLMKGGMPTAMAPEAGAPINRPMLKYPNRDQ